MQDMLSQVAIAVLRPDHLQCPLLTPRHTSCPLVLWQEKLHVIIPQYHIPGYLLSFAFGDIDKVELAYSFNELDSKQIRFILGVDCKV